MPKVTKQKRRSAVKMVLEQAKDVVPNKIGVVGGPAEATMTLGKTTTLLLDDSLVIAKSPKKESGKVGK